MKKYYGENPVDTHLQIGQALLYCPRCKLQTEAPDPNGKKYFVGIYRCSTWKCNNRRMNVWRKTK